MRVFVLVSGGTMGLAFCPTKNDILHRQFHFIITLHTLIAAINNGGQIFGRSKSIPRRLGTEPASTSSVAEHYYYPSHAKLREQHNFSQ